jgi:uncharacterized protein YkwD
MPVSNVPPAYAAQSRAETAIVREINRMRRKHHLHGVRISARLATVAREHSKEMLKHDSLSHSSFDGRSFTSRIASGANRRRVGETLAWAPRGSSSTARVIVRLWMNSAEHRAVLLDGALRHIGVGRVRGAMGSQPGAAITADFTS